MAYPGPDRQIGVEADAWGCGMGVTLQPGQMSGGVQWGEEAALFWENTAIVLCSLFSSFRSISAQWPQLAQIGPLGPQAH